MGLIVYLPESPEASRELAGLTAKIHAEAVVEAIKALSCPADQKAALLDAVRRIHTAKR